MRVREKGEAVEVSAQFFWANPENVKRFQKIESEIRGGVDSRLSSGNVLLKDRRVTSAEDSLVRHVAVGWPIFEFKGSR